MSKVIITVSEVQDRHHVSVSVHQGSLQALTSCHRQEDRQVSAGLEVSLATVSKTPINSIIIIINIIIIIINVLIEVTVSCIKHYITGALYSKLQNNTKRRQAVAGLVTKGRPEQYIFQVVAE